MGSTELEKDVFIKNLEVKQIRGLGLEDSQGQTQEVPLARPRPTQRDDNPRLEECEDLKAKMASLMQGKLTRRRPSPPAVRKRQERAI